MLWSQKRESFRVDFTFLLFFELANKPLVCFALVFDYLFGVDTPEILFRHPALKT